MSIEKFLNNFLREKREKIEEVCKLALENNEVVVIQHQHNNSGNGRQKNIYIKTKFSDMLILHIEINYSFGVIMTSYKYSPVYYEWKGRVKQ